MTDRNPNSRVYRNVLPKGERHVPTGALVERLDRFPRDEPGMLSGSGPGGAHEQTRKSLFQRFTDSELYIHRLVCPEWKTDIENILSTEVEHLLLFEDHHNVREYEEYVQLIKLEDDRQSYPYRKSLSLFCNQVEKIALYSYFANSKSTIRKLTYFGGSPHSTNWHSSLVPFLNRLVEHAPNLETLTIRKLGYFGSEDKLEAHANLFSQLSNIILVQPSKSNRDFWINNKSFGNMVFAGDYIPAEDKPGSLKIIQAPENLKTNKTKVFIHQLENY